VVPGNVECHRVALHGAAARPMLQEQRTCVILGGRREVVNAPVSTRARLDKMMARLAERACLA
jgi:hypothetical protein